MSAQDRSAANERRCPKCGEDVSLFDPAEEDWLDVTDFEDAEVWACVACNWNEEADPDEAFEYHMANLEWLATKLEQMKGAQTND